MIRVVLMAGAIAVVLAASPRTVFDFDRALAMVIAAWTAFGALCSDRLQPVDPVEPARPDRLKPAATLVILVALLGLVRSTAQLTAMEIYATTNDRASLERAACIDASRACKP